MATASETLVERDREVATLVMLADEAALGDGRLVLIEGPPGIGKTRLVDEVVMLARERGMLVLSARGAELEQEFAFGIARQLLESFVGAMTSDRRRTVLAGAAGLAAPLLLPERPGATALPSGELHALLHGLYWLCANLAAQTPLALVVDDAHWGDEASLRWLAYLARRLAGVPALVLVTSRPFEPGSTQATLEALRGDPAARTLTPGPLTIDGVRTVVGGVFEVEPEMAFCQACADSTGGNPFLLHQVARALAAEGVAPNDDATDRVAQASPAAVSRAVLLRLDRLGQPARELARALSVMGPDSELQYVAALAELAPREAVDAVELLGQAAILDCALPPRFTHAILAQAVRSGLSTARRAALHRSAAQLLADDGASPERVAGHLLEADARGEAWAAQALARAGELALARGAPAAAIPFLDRALREPPEPAARPEVLRLLGMAEVRAGRGSGPAHLREALALITEPTARAQTARDVAHALVHAGKPGEALVVLTAVADEVVDAIDPQLVLMLEGERCSLGLFNPATAEAAVNVAVPLARGLRGDPPGGHLLRAVLAITQGSVGEQGTTLPEAVRTAQRALGGERAGDRIFDAPVLYGVVDTLLAAEHFEQAEQALDQAIAVARSRGSLPSYALASSWRGHAHWFRGELREAEAAAADALRVARDAAATLTVPMAAGVLVGALLEQGQLDEAETTLAEAGLTKALPADVLAMFFVLYHRGRLRLDQGRTRDGLRDLMTLQHLRELGGWAFAGMQPGVAAANALVAADEREHARELIEDELRMAHRRHAAPAWEGAALRALACTQNGPTAIQTLRASAEALERSSCLLERTRTLLELGAALRRSNQRTASREPLRHALELAHRCNASPLAERAREELRACGARPRRVMLSGIESLTASELRVVRMAARGLTNTEIAQHLFVTRKTVEVHLSNAYRKLDIRSRRQLPAALET